VAKNEKPVSSKPSKMTVMLFQLEGSDETLQEGFRTINTAIDRLANPVVRVIASSQTKGLPASSNVEDKGAEVFEAEVVEEGETEEVQVERPKTARAPRVPRQPKVLELDFKVGTVPLRTYLEQKNPPSHSRKCLLIAAWLKANLSIDDITMDHIYTAYRHMGWTSPKDITSPVRGMKKQNGWFNKGKEEGSYAINHIGIDVADNNTSE
jgi:hypothetical protein